MTIAPVVDADSTEPALTVRRSNVLRVGYAFMGVGLAIVKWPLLIHDVRSLPVPAGVVTCLLTGLSLLVFLGLRYPVKLLPILLFEVIWKVIWVATVAIPHLVAGDLNPEAHAVLINCLFVVVVVAVIPWRYTWTRFVRAPGDPWH
ncbi:hypothetical protein [Kribbella monticola]|uniref:hypothetical protein n=1 Tax=Kribbella monticola TaxID=2185285 RepID=UPI000DD39FC2|nr:hypothetical protein [Kribbella monticola]